MPLARWGCSHRRRPGARPRIAVLTFPSADMHLRFLLVWIATAGLLAGGTAHAQPAPGAPGDSLAEARPLPAAARTAILGPLRVTGRFDTPQAAIGPDEELAFLEPASSYHPQRFWYGVGSAAALDAVFMVGLASIWYSDSTRTGFHFYSQSENVTGGSSSDDGWLDDWHTFAQQDKLGHVWTSWHITRIVGGYGRGAGLAPAEAGLFGGIVSTVFQTQIEISDGFSETYGFSRTDALANLVGSTVGGLKVAYPERLDWFEAKYSYNPSPYYGTQTTGVDGGNPLGYLGNAIKDYDGITFWVTVRPEEFLPGRAARRAWPDWLALSAGYGGDGLAHAISGMSYPDSPPDAHDYEHRREFYIGPDLDFLHTLDLPQPFQAVARALSFIRLPAPALQLAPEVRWHWVLY